MKKGKKIFFGMIVVALLSMFGGANPAVALPDQNKAAIPVSTAPVDTAITSSDRWLFVGHADGVDIVDTAVFEVVASISARSSTSETVALAVSDDDAYLHILGSDGYIAVVPIASLSNFGPGETVTVGDFNWRQIVSTVIDGVPNALAVGPLPEDNTDQYVFVSVPDVNEVWVTTQSDLLDMATSPYITQLSVGEKPVDIQYTIDPRDMLYPFNRVLYVLLEGSPRIRPYGLGLNGTVDPHSSFSIGDADAGDSLAGFAASSDGETLAAGNSTKQYLHMADVGIAVNSLVITNNSDSPVDLAPETPGAVAWLEADDGSDYFYVATDASKLYIVDPDDGVPTGTIALGAGVPTSAVASSALDEYFYVTDDGGEVQVVTANPWIYDISVTPDYNDGASDTTLYFKSDIAGDFELRRGGSIRQSGVVIDTGVVETADATEEAIIEPGDLEEGWNSLYIFVEDTNGDVGRVGLMLEKDGKPPAPSFELEFGNARIFVTVKMLNQPDIVRYYVYYSTDRTELESDPVSADFVTVSHSDSADKIKVTVDGLENGAKYYFRAGAEDARNLGALSGIKSIIPQKTTTYTKTTGDSGSCAAAPPGVEVDMGGAVFCILMGFAAVVVLRKRISRLRRA